MGIRDFDRLKEDWRRAREREDKRAFFFRKYGLVPVSVEQMDTLVGAREDIEDGIREILNAKEEVPGSETADSRGDTRA